MKPSPRPHSRLPALLAALALALLASACSLVGGGKTSPTRYDPAPRVQADPAWPTASGSLTVVMPSIDAALDDTRIAVSPTAGELQVYRAAEWVRHPAGMVEDAVLRTLEDSGKLAAVVRQGSGIATDYRLLLDVRRFQADYAGQPVPAAVLEVNATLVATGGQGVVASRNFRVSQPATGTTVAQVVDAFAGALATLGHDISGWALQAAPRTTPAASPKH